MGRFLRRAQCAVTPASMQAREGMRGDGSSPAAGGEADVDRGGSQAGRRIAAVGAVAVLGLALHTGDPVRAVPLADRGIAAEAHPGAHGVIAGLDATARPASGSMAVPAASGQGPAAVASQASSFRQIILPDLLIVAPDGLTASQIARLGQIRGLRSMITFDGAAITADGRQVNVIGVNPATFRSWVPLSTASDQAFWTALASGEFVAATAASEELALKAGAPYQLTGATTQVVKFGMAARLDLAGVDLMVNEATSARLGLVHQVAGLMSAPGVSMATLTRKVARILGPGGHIEQLRGQLPVSSVSAGTEPASYIALFQASAAKYCPGLSWTVLAAIGQIESADGTNEGPSSAGALGPMQFLPSTWSEWGIDAFGQTGTPDVMNPYDAVASAARMLCADGAAAAGRPLYEAIFDYNHADWYVNEVLALAAEYAAEYR